MTYPSHLLYPGSLIFPGVRVPPSPWIDCNTGSPTAWEACQAGTVLLGAGCETGVALPWGDCIEEQPLVGEAEYQDEFAVYPHQLIGELSITKRPDAISSNYLSATCLGPVALSDVTQGLLRWPWYVRVENGTVYIARGNNSRTGWNPETVLFSYVGAEVLEVDVAFGQNAQPIVSVSRSDGTIWLYWYNPVPAATVFEEIATGRNARVVLDDPTETTNSDVILFYISDANNAVEYRTQRDRWAIVGTVPTTGVASIFLERVYRTRARRVSVLLSRRNVVAGTYSLETIETTLYPITVVESARYSVTPIGLDLIDAVIPYEPTELLDYAVTPIGVNVVEPVIQLSVVPDSGRFDVAILGVTQLTVVMERTVEVESTKFDIAVIGMAQLDVVIEALNQPIESTKFDVSILGVNVVTV